MEDSGLFRFVSQFKIHTSMNSTVGELGIYVE